MTVHEQSLQHIVTDYMKDKAQSAIVSEAFVKLNTGFWDKPYVDFFFQKGGWMNQRYTMEDAYTFAMLHSDLCLGNIVCCDLRIGVSPSSDVQVDTNLEKLRQGLARLKCPIAGALPCFDVDLWGGNYGEDGNLSWSPYLIFDKFSDGELDGELWIGSETVPLEVGSQVASKTLMQLRNEGALARWPYGSNIVRVFVAMKDGQRKWGFNSLM